MRITLPRTIRHALKIRAGDTLSLDNTREGIVELTNLTTARDKRAAKRKW
jgi:bifunctional DNA-binding transcriptional regulator/antitoxin component of YhaV-PrlF toxin-antitoxin module